MRRFAFLLLAFLAGALPVTAGAYATRHVVIVVIDGGRYSETLGEPNFTWEPQQGFVMEPQGCIAPFWNLGVTTTLAGHAAIFTGTWQPLRDDGSERPHLPTLFEYYRAATGAPASQACFFSNKPKLAADAQSDYPGWGDSLAALCKADCYSDTGVMLVARQHLFTDHPAILAMNLAYTDEFAHSGDWNAYVGAIHDADSLVFDLWTQIQADTALAGRTTLFVTNDHGRHDDQHGGFQNHGDGCYGCQRIQLLAIGPDFKAGFSSTVGRMQVDIAPTVGKLLGFDLPFAIGHSMDELLQPVGELAVGSSRTSSRLGFAAPAPNPSPGAVRMVLDVPAAGELAVDVLDAQGRRVAMLERSNAAPGRRTIFWSGRTAAGRRAAPGAYFVRARLSGRQASARVVLR